MKFEAPLERQDNEPDQEELDALNETIGRIEKDNPDAMDPGQRRAVEKHLKPRRTEIIQRRADGIHEERGMKPSDLIEGHEFSFEQMLGKIGYWIDLANEFQADTAGYASERQNWIVQDIELSIKHMKQLLKEQGGDPLRAAKLRLLEKRLKKLTDGISGMGKAA